MLLEQDGRSDTYLSFQMRRGGGAADEYSAEIGIQIGRQFPQKPHGLQWRLILGQIMEKQKQVMIYKSTLHKSIYINQ